MSGIYGVYNRNNLPVETQLLERMHRVYAQWFDDGSHFWKSDDVGFGYTRLNNSPESLLEILPAISHEQESNLVITADARLDNREELAGLLGLPRCIDGTTDSQLLIAAYEKWGKESPCFLLGDFSYVIWDGSRQEVFCARDHVGVKPFYYHCSPEVFRFANDMEPLQSIGECARKLEPSAIAAYFTYGQLNHPTATFFKEIKKLQPGHSMTIGRVAQSIERYWKPESVRPLQPAEHDDYANEMTRLLGEAIESRAKSLFPVGAHLSGGLDSSAVAVCASRYLRESGKTLSVFNWTHSPQADENSMDVDFEISRRLADKEGMDHHYVELGEEEFSTQLQQHDISFNDTVQLRYEPCVRKEAKSLGVRTILSGWGGDEFVSSSGKYYPAALFWRGQWLRAFSVVRQLTQKKPGEWLPYTYIKRAVRILLVPALPYSWYCRLAGIRTDDTDLTSILNAHWRDLVASAALKAPKFSTLNGHREKLQYLDYGHLPTRLESWAAGGMRAGIEYRYPLLDKRLIEFALGLPEECFFAQGHYRYIFRKAVSCWLPSGDCWRSNTKFEPNRLRRVYSMERDVIRRWQADFDFGIFTDSMIIDRRVVEGLLGQLSCSDSDSNTRQFDNQVQMLFTAVYCAKLTEPNCERQKSKARKEDLETAIAG